MSLFSSSTEKKKTPAEWKDYLTRESSPLTLEEYIGGILLRLAYHLMESSQALQHLEGMVGAIDDAVDRSDPEYAGSAVVREALHTHRRALAELADHPDTARLAGNIRAALALGRN